MSFKLFLGAALLIASVTASAADCSWDHPGQDRFTGDVVKAVDSFSDLDAGTRARLKDRLKNLKNYDDVVTITRDGITGKSSYDPEIRNMHFGKDRLCKTVTRKKWLPDHREHGMVYCEGSSCVMIPAVCGNLSEITRRAAVGGGGTPAPDDGIAGGPGGGGVPLLLQPPQQPPTVPGAIEPLVPPELLVPPEPLPDPAEIVTPPGPWLQPPYLPNSPSIIVLPPPPVPVVPEPPTWILLVAGLLAIRFAARGERDITRAF